MSQDNTTNETGEEYYCEKHELKEPPYPNDKHCPRCRQEQRVQQARQEQMARRADPRMHNSVDARRF